VVTKASTELKAATNNYVNPTESEQVAIKSSYHCFGLDILLVEQALGSGARARRRTAPGAGGEPVYRGRRHRRLRLRVQVPRPRQAAVVGVRARPRRGLRRVGFRQAGPFDRKI